MTLAKLNIIIIGSGLAGLAAASVLRQEHNVTVYERGELDVATGGQGMILYPNGIKIVQNLGFDSHIAGGVSCRGYRSSDMRGKLLDNFPIDFKARYSAELLMMKRSDFRRELLRLATAPVSEVGEERGDPARVVPRTTVTDLEPETATVTFHDGSTAQADVVIVADGIHSGFRHHITGADTHHPKKSGLTLFRISVSADEAIKAIGQLPDWWASETAGQHLCVLQSDDGTHRFIAHYPVQNHNYRNFSCLFPMREQRGDVVESWYADGDKEKMLETFKGFDEQIRKILSIATEVKVWDLQDIDPLPNWFRGRAILIGDAAHAMTPLQGQGANMAMEDADSLQLLRPGMNYQDIQHVFEKVESVRRPRTAAVLQETRHQAGDVTMEERLAKMDYNCSYAGIYAALKEKEGLELDALPK